MNGPPVAPSGNAWVDQLARLVTTVGFPVVAAGLLLWFVLSRFAVDVGVIAARMNANADAIQRLTQTEGETLEELKSQTVALRASAEHLERLVELEERHFPAPAPAAKP